MFSHQDLPFIPICEMYLERDYCFFLYYFELIDRVCLPVVPFGKRSLQGSGVWCVFVACKQASGDAGE